MPGNLYLNILKMSIKYSQINFHFKVLTLAEFDILPDNLLTANQFAIGETSLQLHYYPDSVKMDAFT